MGSYKDVLLRIHEQSFRIQVEMALTDGADHNCGGCMDEVEKVMEEFYQKGEFAFGAFSFDFFVSGQFMLLFFC